MSLFVAVRPSDEAVEDLQHTLGRIRRMPSAQELRWQPAGQWHITLAFLGDDSDDVVAEVCERLEDLSVEPVIDGLRIAGAGCFGRQVLWMDLQDAHAVASLGARAIAYVACDPAALGRDLRIARRLGLTVASIRAFDLFPMTHHVECLALLEPA